MGLICWYIHSTRSRYGMRAEIAILVNRMTIPLHATVPTTNSTYDGKQIKLQKMETIWCSFLMIQTLGA
jgi:hypothetical protein